MQSKNETHRLLIKLKELGLLRHLGVTSGTGKVVLAPGLVESRNNCVLRRGKLAVKTFKHEVSVTRQTELNYSFFVTYNTL